jgi:hypothetical protein
MKVYIAHNFYYTLIMKIRYKCTVTLDGVVAYFKRYGETQEQVIAELTQFIKESYDCPFHITDVKPEKIQRVEKQEEKQDELPKQPQETTDACADERRG